MKGFSILNFNKRFLKFENLKGKILSEDVNISNFFKNKKVLVLYPYPCNFIFKIS